MSKKVYCPYCSKEAVYVDSVEVYGKSYGMIYLCRPCKAWVGVHKGTNKPLGRLADDKLRKAKIEAHFYFDYLWKKKMKQGFSKNIARPEAYKWLAKQLGIEAKKCHIGMFDVDKCNEVINICKRFYR